MTKTEKAIPGTWYTITCTAAATVTQQIDGETAELATLSKSGTTTFRPSASTITVETDGKYHILPTKAPAAGGIGGGGNAGGGASITLDAKPTSGGTNGVTSGGIYDADLHVSLGTGSMAVGKNAVANNAYSVAMGEGAVTGGYYSSNSPTATLTTVSTNRTSTNIWSVPCFSTAVGYHATAAYGACTAYGAYARAGSDGSTASGYYATASGNGATAVGAGCYVADHGCVALNAGGTGDAFGIDEYSDGKSTQLYLIGAGTELADTYTDGEAGLGFVVLDHLAGQIVARGCCKLSSICTQHTTDFSPKNVTNISIY